MTNLESFLSGLNSPDTKASYQNDISLAEKFLKKPVTEANPLDLQNLLLFWREDGRSDATIARRRAAINAFFKFLVDGDIIEPHEVPTKLMNRIKLKASDKKPRALTQEQIPKLMKSLKWDNDKEICVSLAVFMGFHLGMRRSEIADARWEHIDCNTKVISVIGKGKKKRFIPMTDFLFKKMMSFKKDKIEGSILDMNRIEVCNAVLSVAKRMGIYFTTHWLRHSCATSLMRATNGRIDIVQTFLGHSDPSTSARYIDTEMKEVSDAQRKAFK